MTLFELLTGRPPFEGGDDVALMTRHLVETVPDVRLPAPATSAGLAAAIARMTVREREGRYPSARELRVALEALLSPENSQVPQFPSSQIPVDSPSAAAASPAPAPVPVLAPASRSRWPLFAGLAAALVIASAATAVVITSRIAKKQAPPPLPTPRAAAMAMHHALTLGKPFPLIRFDAEGQPDGWVESGGARFVAEPAAEGAARALVADGTGMLRCKIGAGPWRVEGRVRPGAATVGVTVEREKGAATSLTIAPVAGTFRASVANVAAAGASPIEVESAAPEIEGDSIQFTIATDQESVTFEVNGQFLANVAFDDEPPKVLALVVADAAGARFSDLTLRLPKDPIFAHNAAQKSRAESLLPRFATGPSAAADGGDPAGRGLLGRPLPRTRFLLPGGGALDLATFAGKERVVVIVLRGFTHKVCLECSTQTLALADAAPEFERRRARVVLVYPGPVDGIAQLRGGLASLREGVAPPFPVVADPELALVNGLGIAEKLAKPTALVLDAKGIIRYAYVGRNALDRPSAKELLAALDGLGK